MLVCEVLLNLQITMSEELWIQVRNVLSLTHLGVLFTMRQHLDEVLLMLSTYIVNSKTRSRHTSRLTAF